jgi:hypothetical protein
MPDTAFKVDHGYELSEPFLVHRRILVAPRQGFFTGNGYTGFATTSFTYRRILSEPRQAFYATQQETLLATTFLKVPSTRKILTQATLVEVRITPHIPGDTGIEIIYRIPDVINDRPTLIAPPYGSLHRLGSPVMVWTGVPTADYFEVHVALDDQFTQRVARLDVYGRSVQWGWPFGGTYYWRVRAVRDGLVSFYSAVWKFSVPALIPAKNSGIGSDGLSRMISQYMEA